MGTLLDAWSIPAQQAKACSADAVALSSLVPAQLLQGTALVVCRTGATSPKCYVVVITDLAALDYIQAASHLGTGANQHT